MDSGSIFADFFDQLAADEIYDDWRRISENFRNSGEKEAIWRVISRVSCHHEEMYQAGREIEALNPSISSNFPGFLIKFVTAFQSLPIDLQTPLTTKILLKLIDFTMENSKNHVDFVNFADFSHFLRLFEMAGNVLIKDLMEMAVNLYPDDGKKREIGARDLLDGVVMSGEVEAEKFQEEPFLRMKSKLHSMTTSSSSLERKILDQETISLEKTGK